MEDLDEMIMDTLRKLDCSFCSEVDSLSLMGLNDIVEAIVKLLWICNVENKQKIPSFKLPHVMTMKYKAATAIANAIKELGVREEVGYQTLLYPNVFEIRQILISLIEKLPKQAIQTDQNKSPLENLKSQIGSQIEEDLKKTKYPCFCRYLTRAKNSDQKWCLKADQPEFFSFSTSSNSDSAPNFRRHICQTLEGNLQENVDFPVQELTFKQVDWSSSVTPKRLVQKKPALAPKPSLPPKPKPRTTEPPSKSEEKSELKQMQEENDELRIEIENKIDQIENAHSHLHSLQSQIHSKQTELGGIDEKLMQILRDPESQFQSLQKFIDQASSRRQELEETLISWKAEKMPELEQLRQEVGQHSLTNQQLQEAEQKAKQMRKAIVEQTHALHKLQKQAARDALDQMDMAERQKFLSRIMYFVKNVNAQKDEIMRSFQDCQQLEKERRQLEGNLDRTFSVINQWLGNAAESDGLLRKAHSLFIRFHNQNDSIIHSVEETFKLEQEADDFQDQIELLKQQQTDSALDQILDDLMRVKQENEELKEKIMQAKMR